MFKITKSSFAENEVTGDDCFREQFRSTILLVHYLLILMTVIGALLAVMMYVLLGKQGP